MTLRGSAAWESNPRVGDAMLDQSTYIHFATPLGASRRRCGPSRSHPHVVAMRSPAAGSPIQRLVFLAYFIGVFWLATATHLPSRFS